jgi:hypothetical protein
MPVLKILQGMIVDALRSGRIRPWPVAGQDGRPATGQYRVRPDQHPRKAFSAEPSVTTARDKITLAATPDQAEPGRDAAARANNPCGSTRQATFAARETALNPQLLVKNAQVSTVKYCLRKDLSLRSKRLMT